MLRQLLVSYPFVADAGVADRMALRTACRRSRFPQLAGYDPYADCLTTELEELARASALTETGKRDLLRTLEEYQTSHFVPFCRSCEPHST